MTVEAAAGTAEKVRDALRQVLDPELGRNIVDLGLVYRIEVGADGHAEISMTTTVRGCPAAGFLRMAAEASAAGVPGVKDARVVLTYDPPWTPSMMPIDGVGTTMTAQAAGAVRRAPLARVNRR